MRSWVDFVPGRPRNFQQGPEYIPLPKATLPFLVMGFFAYPFPTGTGQGLKPMCLQTKCLQHLARPRYSSESAKR